jgi:RNA polymerase sigma factor (sigma-70 family)
LRSDRTIDATRLFEEHHQPLYRYLVRFCGDEEVAADAAQETFLRLIERPPNEEVGRAWLYRIATNLVIDTSRTRARRFRLASASPERTPMADAPPDPHEAVEADARRAAVAAALATLSAKERTALLMREEGFSHREIAEAVETTTGSVGTLLARALDRLAARLPLDPEHL